MTRPLAPLVRALIVTFALAACGGGESPPSDSASADAASADRSQVTARSDEPVVDGGKVPSQASTGIIAGSPAPITGAIIEVQLIGDPRGYRFEPAQVTAKPGDGVKFVVVSGGPHEIAFDLDAVPPQSRQQLQFNMPNATDGHSPLLVSAQEAWTVSLGGLAPGSYPFVSTPRLPQGMKGEIRIE